MITRLLILNGLAALGVVVHHAAAYGFLAMFSWTNRYLPVEVPNYDQLDSAAFYITQLIRQADAFTIPSFLFVSGFFVAFLAKGKEGRVRLRQVWPRILAEPGFRAGTYDTLWLERLLAGKEA